MKLFLNQCDGFFGTVFREVISAGIASETPLEVYGTLSTHSSHSTTDFPKDIKEIVDKSDQEAVKKIAFACDVIVVDISEDPDLGKFFVEELASLETQDEKIFICLSNVMTWAATKPQMDEGSSELIPFGDEDYRKRRAHPNYKNHQFVEKMTLRVKKPFLRTYVICSGLRYGEKEDWLHFQFKRAWHGEPVIIIGDGNNVVPTIHIRDLASIVSHVIRVTPSEDRYILAVDNSKNTIGDMMKAISNTLGSGAIQTVTKEEALLIEDLHQQILDVFTINIRTEPVSVNEMELAWKCENGPVENIATLVQEFKESRGLTPIHIIVHGPPSSGKTTLCLAIAQEYDIHPVQFNQLVAAELATDSDLANDIRDFLSPPPPTGAVVNTTSHNHNTNNVNPNPRYPDDIVTQILRKHLSAWKYQNQGYVLDGFPETANSAKALFAIPGEDEDENPTSKLINLKPEYVAVLQATDDFLKDRVLNLPESQIKAGYNDEQGFNRRLDLFREENTEETTIVNFYEEHEVLPIYLDCQENIQKMIQSIKKVVGKPHNYGPKPEQIEAERRLLAQQEQERQWKELEATQQQEKAEKQERDKREAEWTVRLTKLEQEEKSVLQLQSAPFRTYLMENIMPTLTSGLIEVCKVRPGDPVDYLAEYLFRKAAEEHRHK